MREYVLRTDGICNTITTVTKDNYIAVGYEVILVDDTYGFDGVRYYREFAPCLRSSRSGLKIMYRKHPDK